MRANEFIAEEKTRLDPKCWTGKKIGNPKTKVKGGVRVNNCVPAESVEETQLATMRDYYAGNKDAKDKTKLSQMRDYFSKVDSAKSPLQRTAAKAGKPDIVIKKKHYDMAEDSVDEDLSRRGFLKGMGAAAAAGAAGSAMAQSRPVDVSREFQNMRQDDPRVQHNKDIEEMARAIYEQIVATRGQPIDRRQQQMWMTIAREKATEKLSKYAPGRPAPQSQSSRFPAQGSERRVSRNIDNFESQGVAEELAEEFDLIENIILNLAEQNQVDEDMIWEDLESLTDDELYVFAVTSQLNEDWQKANKRDRTDGMSQKAVNAYRRENPGSKLKTAVTTKPGKLKKGGKASKRRKSYCSRSRGQMKMHNISCAKTPDKAICKARRRWNC